MGAYAWKTGAWKSGALKTNSWGTEIADGVLSAKYSATPTSGNIGFDVLFTIRVSGSASNVNLQFNWPTTAGSNSATWTNVADTVLTTTKRFTEVSSYQTLLTWKNFEGGLGTQQIEISAKASAGPDPLSAEFTATPTSGQANLTVTFNVYVSGSAQTVELDVDNDGTYDMSFGPVVNDLATPQWQYTSAGLYTVRLKIDDDSQSAIYTRTSYIEVLASAITTLGGGAGGLDFDTWGGLAGTKKNRSAVAFGLAKRV